nr:MAG: hypothetical protein 1 [Aparavirus sp.]
MGKDLNGCKTLGKMLSETSESVMTWFRGDVLGLDEATELQTVIANIGLWFDEVRGLLTRMNDKTVPDRLLEDPDMVLYIENVYRRGLEFSIEISNKRLSEKVRFPFEQHMKLLTELFKKCETSGAFGNKPRISPLVVWLFGNSGVGKSGVTWPLAIDLNNVVLGAAPESEKVNFTKHVYFRNVEQEFWDGYQGQNVVVYDDFGQLKDAQGTPNVEFFEIIRTANISPYPLHMAHLEEKRKAKFVSKVAILTSNESVLNISSLTHPDAVNRRIDIKAEVCVVPQFAKTVQSSAAGKLVTRLDVDKVRKEFGEKVPIATQVYCFKLLNPDSETFTGEVLNYQQFSDLCIRKLNERIGNSHELNKYLELYALQKHPDKDIKCPDVVKDFIVTVPPPPLPDLAEFQINSPLEEEAYFDCPTNIDNNYKYTPILSVSDLATCTHIYTIDGEDISFEISGARILEFNSFDELYKDLINRRKVIYKRIRYSNMLSVRLEESKKSFLESASECLNKVIEYVKENPMTIVLSVVGTVLAGFALVGGWNWLFNDDTEDDLDSSENVNKTPVDINNTVFMRNLDIEKIKNTSNPHIFISQVKKEDLPILSMFPDKQFHVPKIVCSEGNVSGDVITRKATIKVEGNPSGDVVTKKAKVTVEANHSGDIVTRAKPVVRYEGQDVDVELQMWKDQTAQTLISNRILSNLYRMIGVKGERECELMNCLFIRGSVALVPTHVKAAFGIYDSIIFVNSFDVRYTVGVNDIKFVQVSDILGRGKEASLMYIKSKYIHCHADIVKHFTNSFEMSKWHAADVSLPCIRYNRPLNLMLPCILGNSEARALDNSITMTDPKQPVGFQQMALREGMTYRLNTKAGDCGTPVIVNETRVLRKIAGIHVAASPDGTCFAESISQKDLERALNSIEVEYQIRLDLDMLPHKLHNIPLDDNFPSHVSNLVPSLKFNPLGKCVDAPADATKTALRPSRISGKIVEPMTKPAYLRPVIIDGVNVDIKRKNLAKAAMDTPFIQPREVRAAIIPVEKKLLSNIRPELRRVLTFEEGIAGSDISFYCEPINRSSSPGYPWINSRALGSKGKQQWLGSDEYVFDESVRQKVNERIRLAKLGLRMPTIWVDTLKDERRPIAKVNAGKTRVFANGPMDFTIAFRMYFLTFMAHVMENRIYNEQSIGTNTWSPDWTKTAKYLSRKAKDGENFVIAGDFSTFDGTLNSCIVGEFVDVINKFYNDGPENALIRQVLFLEVFNSIHLCQDTFYMWTHSQPSGCPITTVLNSFYNSISMRIVFNRLALDVNYKFVNKFDEYCTMVSYGDDNVVNISPDIIDWFNQISISKGYESIGMIYTDEGKTGEMVPHRSLHEVAYLKRQFDFSLAHGVYKAPLDLDVILEMTNWIRDSLDDKFSTLENCSNAIRELSQHPREIFDRYVPIINECCLTECNDLPSQLTFDGYWEECMYEYYS